MRAVSEIKIIQKSAFYPLTLWANGHIRGASRGHGPTSKRKKQMTQQEQISLIITLQERLGKVEKIDPNGALANKMRALMGRLDAEGLRFMRTLNIKWLSSLALVELIIRGEKVDA